MTNAIAGDHRQSQSRGQRKQRLIAALLVAAAVALQFEVEMRGAEDGLEPVSDFASSITASMRQRYGQRSLITSSKTDEPSGKLFDIFERGCAFSLCRLAHLEASDELA